ncbi:MAG: hypothetical protein BMS9Abin12_0699 [Acidimicrobiia bacterium]|nr:MAG: hypothetical protein BMS9Abin12_0699 [Acidimicrobiia bacterium]
MNGSASSFRLSGMSKGPGSIAVVWSRGRGCASLAEVLGGNQTSKADGDLRNACIEARADLLVSRSLTSFDLVDVAVPHHFAPEKVRNVVAAVAGGPHSSLATRIAGYLARGLGVSGQIVIASPSDAQDIDARAALAELPSDVAMLPRAIVRAPSARTLVDTLIPGTLLVLGAPGGSWTQRQFFGPGRKLLFSAPAGAVIVRSAPRRCFQAAEGASPVGTRLKARDAASIIADQPAMPVAEAGKLVGIIRRAKLIEADNGATVGDLMEAPVFLHVDDPIEDVPAIANFLSGGPVPIVDHTGGLFGTISGEPIEIP